MLDRVGGLRERPPVKRMWGEGDSGCQNCKKGLPPGGETEKCAVGGGIANVLKCGDASGG